ncbi:uncharacterized protein LOC134243541 [Saccostrea cucullata]|uniref:uncharacterized protein LOC134243541 n=1 Tax=Saccostrea cuccullata TaxID=36930 RepID=UPI002ED2494C
MHSLPLWLGLSFVASLVEAATEYLHNADFENTSFNGSWVCEDCIMTSYSADVYHGSKSIKVINRQYNWSSPQDNVHVPPGHNYVARMYFKLLDMPHNVTTVEVDLMAAVNTHGKIHGINVAVLPYQELRYGWTEISGDFFVPAGTTSVKLFLQVTEPSVDYLLDDCSLQQLPHIQHWHSDAVSRISNIRKTSVSLRYQ